MIVAKIQIDTFDQLYLLSHWHKHLILLIILLVIAEFQNKCFKIIAKRPYRYISSVSNHALQVANITKWTDVLQEFYRLSCHDSEYSVSCDIPAVSGFLCDQAVTLGDTKQRYPPVVHSLIAQRPVLHVRISLQYGANKTDKTTVISASPEVWWWCRSDI